MRRFVLTFDEIDILFLNYLDFCKVKKLFNPLMPETFMPSNFEI